MVEAGPRGIGLVPDQRPSNRTPACHGTLHRECLVCWVALSSDAEAAVLDPLAMHGETAREGIVDNLGILEVIF